LSRGPNERPAVGRDESSAGEATPAEESAKAEPGEVLEHDSGKSAGQRGIAGSGHAVRFEAPGDDRLLTSAPIFGARYGYPRPPDEDFHVWLCDETMPAIAEYAFPYADFKRGDPEWVTLQIEATKVPKKFIVCAGFNPEQTKWVYVHYDDQPAENSLTGLPGQEAKVFSTGNWLIRATLAPAQIERAE
jgi:RNA polymerase sigma-70 factor (ECF subfamily)